MIDIAKVADLVLLLCDASFGFEMEVFEFLNICQVHGMPKIMGVLTHLDMIKNSKTLKTTKKTLKHRFWTEVYPGAKLFYLSGIIHGEYLRNEIKNLGRFISVMKFRPLIWRTTHSYLLGDRYEDLTNQELIRKNPKCDRTVSLYGYIRGVPLNKEGSVHVAGLGDLRIHNISYLPDPCPLPEQIKKRALVEKEKLIYAPFSGVGGIVYDKDAVYVELGGSHSHNKRNEGDETENIFSNLIEAKETLDVKMAHSEMQLFSGGEKIAAKDWGNDEWGTDGNIQLFEKNEAKKEEDELNAELKALKMTQKFEEVVGLDGRTRRRVVFDINDDDFSKNIDEESGSDEESDDEEENTKIHPGSVLKGTKRNAVHEKISNVLQQLESKVKSAPVNEESDDSGEEYQELNSDEEVSDEESEIEDEQLDEAVKWKENLKNKAEEAFFERQKSSKNLMKLVYGVFDVKHSKDPQIVNEEPEDDEIGGLFKKISRDQHILKQSKDSMNLVESTLQMPWSAETKDFLEPENKLLIANCFVTGKWKESEDASELLKLDDQDLEDSDEEVFGDFEDLETGEKHTSSGKAPSVGEKRKRTEEDEDNREDNRKTLAEKKRKLKEKFDAEYDNTDKNEYYDELKMEAEKQAQLNKAVFENMPDDVRVQIEGFRPGMYVRMEFLNVPAEFVENFDPTYPLVIGALNMGEENIGYVNVRVKKHRWYNKILKTSDPLIISLGWRRFQTIPLYSKLEDDLKFRYLKYTPEHLSCNAHFWGPITPQGTGFLALQAVDSNSQIMKKQGFRIAATGTILELDKSTQILKKLKLIGYPLKIYKKTAFIKGLCCLLVFCYCNSNYFRLDMFNSALEVAKFEGARIKTVSGIRGQIKKAVSKPDGCFRATFEDKIQLSGMNHKR